MALQCTQAERDELASAIKSGVMRVAYADKTVQYHSIEQMRALLDEMDEYLAGSSAPARTSRAIYSRG